MSIIFDKISLRHEGFELSIDCTLKQGRKYAVLGPSGCGKSTFFSALAGFKDFDEGRFSIAGQDLTTQPPSARPISLLFQDHNLFPHMSVFKNVALGLRSNLKLSVDDTNTIANALDQVGLGDAGHKLPSELSGGQQQRVAIARAILRDKPIMLLDEPFAALGPALKHDMLDLVGGIVDRTEATLLMITHDPDDAAYIADETIFVSDGVMHAPRPTHDLFANPPEALRDYMGTKKAG